MNWVSMRTWIQKMAWFSGTPYLSTRFFFCRSWMTSMAPEVKNERFNIDYPYSFLGGSLNLWTLFMGRTQGGNHHSCAQLGNNEWWFMMIHVYIWPAWCEHVWAIRLLWLVFLYCTTHCPYSRREDVLGWICGKCVCESFRRRNNFEPNEASCFLNPLFICIQFANCRCMMRKNHQPWSWQYPNFECHSYCIVHVVSHTMPGKLSRCDE